MTLTDPATAASRLIADPSQIAAHPTHLILLGVVVLVALGYGLYRRTRDKRYEGGGGR